MLVFKLLLIKLHFAITFVSHTEMLLFFPNGRHLINIIV